jgi:hypothetical protein
MATEIKCGDKVEYSFPEPTEKGITSITGIVEYIGDSFVSLKTESLISMKISFKNFHLLRLLHSSEPVIAPVHLAG